MLPEGSGVRILSDTEIAMARAFNAPRDLVWAAYVSPMHLENWWGLPGNKTRIDAQELHVGGKWRYVETSPDGQEHAFRGEFLEIAPPERLVYTFEYEPMAGHIITDTVTLEDLGQQTLVHVHSRFANKEDRDGMLATGMEQGAMASWARLDEVLENLVRG